MGPEHLLAVFSVTFLVTAPLHIWCRNYADAVSANVFVQAANSAFVTRYGTMWLIIVYWGLLISARLSGPRKHLFSNGAAKFAIQMLLLLICNWWFFGAPIFERLNVATGGHCESTISKSITSCKDSLSAWVGGFDFSGHYYFLTTSSLLVAHGWKVGQSSTLLLASKAAVRISYCFKCLAVLILAIWYCEFLVTSLFFHTAFEKLAALAGMMAVFACLKLPDKYISIQNVPLPNDVV